MRVFFSLFLLILVGLMEPVLGQVDCSKTWLVLPEDPQNPGKKVELSLGDIKPQLEAYINNGQKLGSFYVGKATECEIACTPQVSAYGRPEGISYGAFMDGGRYDSYVIDRPGKYIIVAQSVPGNCYLAETFVVSCGSTSGLVDTLIIQFSMSGTLGSNLVENLDVKVYPNPVSHVLQVVGLPEGQNVVANIYNLAGEVVGEYSSPALLDVTSLPAGGYILKFSQPEKLLGTVKFIKQ